MALATNEHVPVNAAGSTPGDTEPAGRRFAFLDDWKRPSGPSPALVALLSILSAVTLMAAALHFAGVLTRPSLSDAEEAGTRWVPSFELPETARWVGPDLGEAAAVPETAAQAPKSGPGSFALPRRAR